MSPVNGRAGGAHRPGSRASASAAASPGLPGGGVSRRGRSGARSRGRAGRACSQGGGRGEGSRTGLGSAGKSWSRRSVRSPGLSRGGVLTGGGGGPPWKRPARLVGALRVWSQARGRPGGGPRVGESWVSLLSARAPSGGAAILSPLRLSSGGREKHRLEVGLRACLYPLGLRRTLVFGVGVLKCLARNGREKAWELGTPLSIGFHRFKFSILSHSTAA